MTRSADRCPYCGDVAELELVEAWDLLSAQFMVDACCEGAEQAFRESWDDPSTLNALGVGQLLGSPVRAVHQYGLAVTIDCRLTLGPIRQADAKAFVRANHRHCPNPPPGWKFGLAARNAGRLVGVAMVGRPVARLLDDGTALEVNRLCTVSLPIAKQAASMLLAAAAREARRRGARRIITYTNAAEAGVSLVAAGWQRDAVSQGGVRSRVGRARSEHNLGPKVRCVRWL